MKRTLNQRVAVPLSRLRFLQTAIFLIIHDIEAVIDAVQLSLSVLRSQQFPFDRVPNAVREVDEVTYIGTRRILNQPILKRTFVRLFTNCGPHQESHPSLNVQLEHQVQIDQHTQARDPRHQRHFECQRSIDSRLPGDHRRQTQQQHSDHTQATGQSDRRPSVLHHLQNTTEHNRSDAERNDSENRHVRRQIVDLVRATQIQDLQTNVTHTDCDRMGLGFVCLIAQNKHTNGDHRVGHQRADGHHVDQLIEIEEQSHYGGQQTGQDGGQKWCFRADVDRAEAFVEDSVRRHGVEDARKGKHGAQQIGAEGENGADRDDPFDFHPADVVEDNDEGGSGAL